MTDDLLAGLRPIRDHIIAVRLAVPTVSKGGIDLSMMNQTEKNTELQILAVGPGKWVDGSLIPVPIEPGQIVIVSKTAGQEFKHNGIYLLKIWEHEIIGIKEVA